MGKSTPRLMNAISMVRDRARGAARLFSECDRASAAHPPRVSTDDQPPLLPMDHRDGQALHEHADPGRLFSMNGYGRNPADWTSNRIADGWRRMHARQRSRANEVAFFVEFGAG